MCVCSGVLGEEREEARAEETKADTLVSSGGMHVHVPLEL